MPCMSVFSQYLMMLVAPEMEETHLTDSFVMMTIPRSSSFASAFLSCSETRIASHFMTEVSKVGRMSWVQVSSRKERKL